MPEDGVIDSKLLLYGFADAPNLVSEDLFTSIHAHPGNLKLQAIGFVERKTKSRIVKAASWAMLVVIPQLTLRDFALVHLSAFRYPWVIAVVEAYANLQVAKLELVFCRFHFAGTSAASETGCSVVDL